jgi:SulP family sulfate permease
MPSFFRQLAAEFHPKRFFPSLTAGLIAGIVAVMVEISLAALIFSGDLSRFVSSGIGITLFSSFVIGLVVSLTSAFRGVVGVGQDIPAAILGVVAAAIATSLPASTPPEEVYATVVAAIAVTSLVTGVGFFLLGLLRLGGLVRFIPYPVIGGFLAGTGWLLIKGSFGVMADASLTISGLPGLFAVQAVTKWLPGLLFAVLLYLIARRYSHFLIIPGLLLAAVLMFYIVMWAMRVSVAEAGAQGWFLGSFPAGALWRPLTPGDLRLVQWQAIFGNVGSIATILLVSTVSLLLNASGLELTVRRDVDLDRELRASGLATILSGLGGGTPGYMALSLSALGYRLKAESRLVGILAAGVCGLTLFIGAPLLAILPRPVIGGLLFFLGLSFLVEWIYDSWFKLSRGEYVIVLLILIAMNVVGVLEGVGLGILLAVGLFVLEYSRTSVVKHTLTGSSFHSNVDRPKLYEQLLLRKGELSYILELQGFIFFGTANKLLDRVRERVGEAGKVCPHFVLLDFRQVIGLDASAILSFTKIIQLAQSNGFVLIFTDLNPVLQKKLSKDVLTPAYAECCLTFTDLNHGVEWCEEQIIQQIESAGLKAKPATLLEQIEKELPSSANLEQLKGYCQKMQVEAGHVLIHQGQHSAGMFFIESGGAEARLNLAEGKSVRLRKMSPGTIVGEVGLYADMPTSASVLADQTSTLYFLSRDKLLEMEQKSPDLAAALHRFIARLLGERLFDSTSVIQSLLQ